MPAIPPSSPPATSSCEPYCRSSASSAVVAGPTTVTSPPSLTRGAGRRPEPARSRAYACLHRGALVQPGPRAERFGAAGELRGGQEPDELDRLPRHRPHTRTVAHLRARPFDSRVREVDEVHAHLHG